MDFSFITSIIPNALGFIMRVIYDYVKDYGLTLFLFTLVTKIVLFPLAIKQQKSSATMSAYQPLINEINKTYANDKAKQQEEYQKLQQEYGFSPLAGCLPLLIQLPIMFGLIDVVYKPLTYIFGVAKDVTAQAVSLAGLTTNYTIETQLIRAVKLTPDKFSGIMGADVIAELSKFNPTLFGMDLTSMPSITVPSIMWVIPVLSAGTMLFSTIITSKMSGQEMAGSMKAMPYMMTVMFGYLAFTLPAGVSFYWIFSNLFGILQSIILKRIYDPAALKEKVLKDIEEKRANSAKKKKKNKTITVKTEAGETVEKTVSLSEIESIRLQKAREIDDERYKE